VCQPPPPPNFDHVSLEGIEVIQSIQDTANSVSLVAGKTTWVRVYLGKSNGSRTLTGVLRAKRGGATLNLNAVVPIVVDASENLAARRKNWNKSLNFAVPATMTGSGTTIFTVDTLTDMSCTSRTMICTNYIPKKIICSNCGTPTQVSFSNMPPLIVHVIGLTY